jgi:glycosyltransferase involved in cell wall biosynthesis
MNLSPLVSFCVVTFNHEKYIKCALESVLAQTYSPLELIISDDCSTDNTPQIIDQVLANYRGPHKIRILNNEKNLGMIGNYNQTFLAAKGELLFTAAGDDVFLHDRAQVIVDAWNKHDQRPTLIASSFLDIDGNGEQIGERILQEGILECSRAQFFRLPNPLTSTGPGAVMVYSRQMIDVFGPISELDAVEDLITVRRARLLGNILTVRKVLVKYRRTGMSNRTKEFQQYRKQSKFGYYSLKQICTDLDTIAETIHEDELKELKEILHASLIGTRRTFDMWENNFVLRAQAFWVLSRYGRILFTHPSKFFGHLIAVFNPQLGCKIWRKNKR